MSFNRNSDQSATVSKKVYQTVTLTVQVPFCNSHHSPSQFSVLAKHTFYSLFSGGTTNMPLSSPSFTNSNTWTTKQHTPQLNNTFQSLDTSHNNTLPIIILSQSLHKTRAFRIHCIAPEPLGPLEQPKCDRHSQPEFAGDGGGGDGGGDGSRSGGNGDGGGSEEEEEEDKEFGPLLKFEAVMKEAEARGVKLPSDMVDAARISGIRENFLLRYFELQGSAWPLSFLMKHCSMLRNRMLADPSFLFKVGAEIIIDSCCATFAEVQRRGKDFWAEFELYAADLLVGVAVDIALVGMLAPYARIGKPSVSKGLLGRFQHACSSLPSSVFEAETPGFKFSVKQRIATYFYKGALYGSVGFGCGIIGQGIANMIMNAKRSFKKSEEDIPVPPLLQSAALWGFFLAVSSNTRYQIINGLERLVEASPVAKNVPLVAMAFTVGVRFGNNIYGGMQFVDWAKLSGVQ
ncbi:protein RETICULATA-RELATED 1, chloroplastic [Gastrolobium bilobum]|uniref:protein RETICULATA-RELATED 1, chloroplastic n=1 Tax=Gastrolobium bilobum TaxID=150636 RepID=UPI002AB0C443|nr:protein RETICULATA-RELATED 1, chloroplastic [Gastrolobium bilobum]